MRRTADEDELLTVAETSEEKGISPDGVRAAIRAKRLPAIKKSFGYLIKRSDVIAWKPRGWKPDEEGT